MKMLEFSSLLNLGKFSVSNFTGGTRSPDLITANYCAMFEESKENVRLEAIIFTKFFHANR